VLLDVVAVAALAGLLAVAFAHPRGRTETLAGLAAAGAVLASGAVSLHDAGQQVERMLPVVLFLAAILVVAETCAAEGLFAAVGDAVRRAGRGDPHRVLPVTFLAASLITAALSLDATVVLLTPVVAAAVAGSRSERPVVHACVRLANSASLLLPVSNLTNLLALPDVDLSFLGWFAVMAPVWVVVIVVEYVGVRVYFVGDLRAPVPRCRGRRVSRSRSPASPCSWCC
jgi:arsenical pump membrane protein